MVKVLLTMGMVLLLVSLSLVSCVSQSNYDEVLLRAANAEAKVPPLERDLDKAQTDLQDAQNRLASEQEKLEVAEDALGEAEGQLATLSDQITSLQSQVSSLEGSLASAETSLALRKASVLDQAPEPPWFGRLFEYIYSDVQAKQSFVPTYPVLTAVEVNIFTVNPTRGDDDITLRIFDENGNEMASSMKHVTNGFEGWLRFEIENGLNVAVGSNLVINLEDTGKIVFGWKYLGGDVYLRGSRTTFAVPKDGDFMFRTYGADVPK